MFINTVLYPEGGDCSLILICSAEFFSFSSSWTELVSSVGFFLCHFFLSQTTKCSLLRKSVSFFSFILSNRPDEGIEGGVSSSVRGSWLEEILSYMFIIVQLSDLVGLLGSIV